jgi:hypothetical protein
MTQREQKKANGARHMSSLLWNMFTGSAPYREIFVGALHPGFIGGLLWNLALGARSAGASEPARPCEGANARGEEPADTEGTEADAEIGDELIHA